MRDFSAPWGNLLKVISSLVTLVLIGIYGSMAFTGRYSSITTAVLFAAIPLLILGSCLLFSVRGYRIEGNHLRIRRMFWFTDIDITKLTSVVLDPKAMTGSIRTLGNGGLYSFSGRFRSAKLGSFRAYVTDFKNCVIVKTTGETIVISPDNPEMFIEILRNR